MRPILFKCPTTGLNVQWSVEDATSEREASITYQAVHCPACTRLHFMDLSTGKLLGEK